MSVDNSSSNANSSIVVVGMACRVPGADSVSEFADLLFEGRTGYGELPADRCDRSLYFDPLKGKVGKSYTTVGGTVPERPIDRKLCPLAPGIESLYDVTHRQFAEVAAAAWQNAELTRHDQRLKRTGIYVGHSGGTKAGGALSLGTQIEEALALTEDVNSFRELPVAVQRDVVEEVTRIIRKDRPARRPGAIPQFHAYQAAALTARILGLTGPRTVIDAACASSLVSLAQAILAIRAGRIDSAVVGGATYNNIDNLILFSHSQACTATDSRPFDDHASGLVSSEGYVAIVIMTQQAAVQLDLPILGVIRGVGMASDGKGRSLWAPRMEGQVLALQRAYSKTGLLDIDYLEAHATSTQLGDATELETLRTLASQSATFSSAQVSRDQLLLGSVKSNIGHTLEAAGLIGLVKVLIAMQRRQIPPSLRFEHPNHNYDWTTAPIRVVSRIEPWPENALSRRPRRAAVSAFGIGGLNAHLVVEESGGSSADHNDAATAVSEPNEVLKQSDEAIAIVGRGIVVAGATNLNEFKTLLESNRSMLIDAPQDRWRNQVGVSTGTVPESHRTPHCHGGFVTNFSFDGGSYAIPPKQVQQANPAQLMLIDAVNQAIRDLNRLGPEELHRDKRRPGAHKRTELPWPVDRQRISVVIGAIFGGEFGDQLQVGMRLPEICGQLSQALVRHGITAPIAKQTADAFRQMVLKNRPALLDETGSFTASTLASRIAKTFDLMGGACALDTDNTSGLSALATAVDQLRSGVSDMVICGSAQRSLSLAAFEALDLGGQLVRSGRHEDVPDDCRQILPGEGVSTLILCRLSDAKRLNLPIHGILNNVIQDFEQTSGSTNTGFEPIEAFSHSSTMLTAADARIVRQIGYLSGTHSLVRITAETLRSQTETNLDSNQISIAARTTDGVVMQTSLAIPISNLKTQPRVKLPSSTPRITPLSPQISTVMKHSPITSTGPLRRVRVAATGGASLLQLLRAAIQLNQLPPDERVIREIERAERSPFQFLPEDTFRITILTSSVERFQKQLTAAIKSVEAGKFRALLDRERVVLWQTSEDNPRVAWLFPGQGAHYHEAPAVFTKCDAAQETLAEVDRLYVARALPKLSTAFDNKDIKPGTDIWWAQAWVLGVSASLTAALKANGMRPDAVLGHSFGEFSASLAANVTRLPHVIELAQHRANAIISHMRISGGLLSIRAAVHEVDAILKSATLPVYVTHLNSTRQTVIAGSREAITAAKALLDSHGLASMFISVPAPFHTPLMSEAEVAFGRMSAGVEMRSPTCGFMSATSVQYLSEPSDIRKSLVRQLTQPVLYMPSVQRLLGEKFRVLLEVGPNDVLTRMNRDFVGSEALCLSLDIPGQPFSERLQLVNATLETVANTIGNVPHIARVPENSGVASGANASVRDLSRVSETLFDVTRSGRNAHKAISTPEWQPSDSIPVPATAAVSLPVQVEFAHSSESPTTSGISDDQLKTFVLDLVVELTGYDPDIVEFDADLEAHLGIDSIKKAQILGEIGVWLGLTVRPDGLRFDSVRTLNDAIQMIRQLAESDDSSRPVSTTFPVKNDTTKSADESSTHLKGFSPSDLSHSEQSNSEMKASARLETAARILPPDHELDSLLIEYVVDQTGYDRNVVDLDADLEADLGLDSIKLAQLIGQMREQFNLDSLTLDLIGQRRFSTLRSIREFLIEHTGDDDSSATSTGVGSSSESSLFFKPAPTASDRSRPIEVQQRVAASTSPTQIRGMTPISDDVSEWQDWFAPEADFAHPDAALNAGLQQGKQHRKPIRAALRSIIGQPASTAIAGEWNAIRAAHLKGLAAGAGVAENSVRHAAALIESPIRSDESKNHRELIQSANPSAASNGRPDVPATKDTRRFALRVVPAPRRRGMPVDPVLHGTALILGDNAVSEALANRIRKLGQKAIVLNTSEPIASLEKQLADIWSAEPTPHLFMTMSFDADSALDLTEERWKVRRPAALEVPFRICQLWMQRTIDLDQMENASVVGLMRLGGDFGFSGQRVDSIEAIGGLVKAMLIEAWMRGFRTCPMKVIDIASDVTPESTAQSILQELAVPSYDMEIAIRSVTDSSNGPSRTHATVSNGKESPTRFCVQAVPAPLTTGNLGPSNRITRGGTWIVSGGGRGITAVIAMTLAKKYDLKLHLLGTAPVPQLSDDFVRQVKNDRSAVRNRIMQDASTRRVSPVEAWRNTEKALEIHATLRGCKEAGIAATYHCCDVANFDDVESTITAIRKQEGSLNGVIHGAGAGQDARFDRKRPDKVEKCLRAKIDGSMALMQATQLDPLEWFVTFGSISGRFGANGHTDYSLANDMMAKIVDRYRSERPDVRSLTFHWHAWGDIGMATKPEAKLALEMIDMEFMPARDGIAHFMRELEFGGDEPEVLITDESYFRKFFPADRLATKDAATTHQSLPLLPSTVIQQSEGVCSSVVTLNPVSDKFLSQHCVKGQPTLPIVVALELMAEGVRLRTGLPNAGVCLKAQALQSIRFASDDPLAVTVQTRATGDGLIECRLLADVRRRDGRMVVEDREYIRAVFKVDDQPADSTRSQSPASPTQSSLTWKRIEYGRTDSLIYHGPELQELREIADDGQTIFGRIAASASVQLFGSSRAVGFTVPCSTMDACLYAIGYGAWIRHGKPSLPVSFGKINFGRLPDPGEPCLVKIEEIQQLPSGALWKFELNGHNGDRLLTVDEYQIGWLGIG